MIPLYGFLEGDTLGLLILADEQQSAASLARALQSAAALRVAPREGVSVWVKGARLDARTTVDAAGLRALDRFDVRRDQP
ncbi:MAG TPA: toluene-4-monooxygenase system B family protein [Polyangia bacterium]|nr:toluene-4-monooxygenase system B family protein [Polyangia bacterium]